MHKENTMQKHIVYFCLGSISTLGIFNTVQSSLLNIASLSAFLLFVFFSVSETYHHNTHRFGMFVILDMVVLISMLIFEHLALSNTILLSINFRIINVISGTAMILSVLFFLVSLYCTVLHREVTGILDRNSIWAYVRHPIYSSISLFILSSCVYGKCFGTLGYFVYKLRTTFITRIKEEENAICKEYPNYNVYKKEVNSGLIFY
ncbi:hypothetical protein NGRA_1035 [Nosema granulosis]|uniref:Protein-S-isoprenylcysteine O-methyltransferase n=1 Tax=Nosema granulosis TaxID=83296 RepID=A0A9P6KZR9_9MICR|nr:hypothetical protein NGRA_1035 [Nosema granulosis]